MARKPDSNQSRCTAIVQVGTVLSPMLLALGETSRFSAITIVTVILGLVAALVFLPFWGMNRAARAFAMILAAVLTFLVLSRKLRLQLDLEAIWKSLVAGTVIRQYLGPRFKFVLDPLERCLVTKEIRS